MYSNSFITVTEIQIRIPYDKEYCFFLRFWYTVGVLSFWNTVGVLVFGLRVVSHRSGKLPNP